MSNNVYKANFIQFSPENTKVIDANSLVAKRLEGFSGVLREKEEETVSEDFSENEENSPMDELLADRDAPIEEEASTETVESVAEEIERMKQEAASEVEEMKRQALEEAESIKDEIIKDAREQGYSEGAAKAEEEALGSRAGAVFPKNVSSGACLLAFCAAMVYDSNCVFTLCIGIAGRKSKSAKEIRK